MKLKKKFLRCVTGTALSAALVMSSVSVAFAQATDVPAGHWAAKSINKWTEKGYIAGYEDGTFKPNNKITRAEFMRLVNQAFGFTKKADIDYKDVNPNQWFYDEVQIAKAAGYISGYEDGTMKPGKQISREEAAVIVAKALKLEADAEAASKFKDASSIASWSKGSVGAAAKAGAINGYEDNTFQPKKNITRAETVVMLDLAMSGNAVETFDKAGTYGPATGTKVIEGNVLVTAPGVKLQNLVIKGDLTIAEGVGEGEVELNNVTVEGKTSVKGGGENSIKVNNSKLNVIVVAKANGKVRVVVSGNTSVANVTLESGAKLEESNLTGTGFVNVTVSASVASDAKVQLVGNFGNVEVASKGASVQVSGGKIESLTVTASAEGVKIEVAAGAEVGTLTLNAKVTVTGNGKIVVAKVNASGVTLEIKPDKTETASGVTPPSTGGSGGGGTGSGSSGDSSSKKTTAALSASAITVNNTTTTDTITITGLTNGDVIKVYAASTGDTILVQGTASGSSLTLNFSAPLNANGGKVYVTRTETKKYESSRTEVTYAAEPATPSMITIAGIATDDTVTVTTDDTTNSSGDTVTADTVTGDTTWVVELTSGTFKSGVSVNDITVSNLPSGLSVASVNRTANNTIQINVSGKTNTGTRIPDDYPVGIVVKASAVNENANGNSASISAKIKRSTP